METDNTNQPVPPQAPLPNPSSSSKTFIIILGVAVVAIISIGAYLLGTKQTKPVAQNQQTSVSPTTIPIPTADPTANWKTYKSDKYAFEFTYPSNWNLFINEDSNNFPFYVSLKPSTNSRSSILIQPVNSKDQSVFSSSAWDTKIQQITFSQRAAKAFSGDYGNLYVRLIRIEDVRGLLWNQFNEISYSIERSDLNYRQAFDQILSTFQFLDQQQTSAPKYCKTDNDCGLLACSGCFSKEYLKNAPPDLPCYNYPPDEYACSCIQNACKETTK